MSDPLLRLNAALQGRYRVERQLGEGGMATVYLAEDLKHRCRVALKVLKLAAVVGAGRFLAEIETTANLQHPHILPLFDSGEADGFLFSVMPHVEGESRAEYAHSQGEHATAIGFVNALRMFHGLPQISGAFLASLTDGTNDAAQVRAVILEEKRRELFSQQARYWSTKIRNADTLWFPHRQGQTTTGFALFGGVRLAFPPDEYTLNPNFAALGHIDTVRGSFCDSAEAPVF